MSPWLHEREVAQGSVAWAAFAASWALLRAWEVGPNFDLAVRGATSPSPSRTRPRTPPRHAPAWRATYHALLGVSSPAPGRRDNARDARAWAHNARARATPVDAVGLDTGGRREGICLIWRV